MKAIVIESYLRGGLDQFPNEATEIASLKKPKVSPSQSSGYVRIRVKAIGLNFFDLLNVQGKYQVRAKTPFIPGSEFSGQIIEIDDEAIKKSKEKQYDWLKIGANVFGSVENGAFAQELWAPLSSILPIPKQGVWSLETTSSPSSPSSNSWANCAGIHLTLPTAYAALHAQAKVKAGDWVLVHAAAGAIGQAACQIARAAGAKVIGTVGSPSKLDDIKEFTDYAICYGNSTSSSSTSSSSSSFNSDWIKGVKQLTGNRGVDVVIDTVGLVNESLGCLEWSGRIVILGFTRSGSKGLSSNNNTSDSNFNLIQSNRILLKNAQIYGLFWGAWRASPNAEERSYYYRDVWEKGLFPLMREGKIKPFHSTVKGSEDGEAWWKSVKNGLLMIEARKNKGKLVVLLPSLNNNNSKL